MIKHDESLQSTELLPPVGDQPTAIGPYRLLRKIGEGGMGEVWEAEQEHPVRRKVALKLIKWGMDTKRVIARFESERQALALMNHPHIAKVYEAGATEQGRPYFVMEYVQGVPITEYCDRHRLDTRARLELLISVCTGVQHAHQKGIIHRDIKPSNVLVAVQDDRPAPKLIDFGVAKATAQRLTEKTVFTELGQLIGTPEYMSPEQAEMTVEDVDTRTDVYSLGIVLYELLTGVLPFDSRELRQLGFDGIRRVIRTEDPLRPSTRVRTLGDAVSAEAARRRRTDVSAMRRQLQGDLDWITMRALEKDRTRRYGSASELAADISRHLRHEPVQAGPPSTLYRAGKFVRRHRLGVLACGVVLVALLAGIAGTTVGLVRAWNAERQASQEAATATQVTEFLVGLFEVVDPSEARGNTITAREILDRGAERIGKELADQPAIRATLEHTMGRVYHSLGLKNGLPLMEKALETRRSLFGEQSLEVAATLHTLGRVAPLKGGVERLTESLSIRRRLLGNDHLDVADTLYWLARWRSERMGEDYAEVEALAREALEIRRRHLGDRHLLVAEAMGDLGTLHSLAQEFESSEPLLVNALALERELREPDHPKTADLLFDIGSYHYAEVGDHVAAERCLREALEILRKVYPEDYVWTAQTAFHLGGILEVLGRHQEAEELYRGAIDARRESEPRWLVARYLTYLADLRRSLGDVAEAESLYREAIEAFRVSRKGGLWRPQLASLLAATGRPAEAEQLYRQTLQQVDEQEGLADWAFPYADYYGLAELLDAEGRRDEALELCSELLPRAMAGVEAARGPVTKLHVWRWFIRIPMEEALGGCLMIQGHYESADTHLTRSAREYGRYLGERHYSFRGAIERVARLYEAWDKPEKAAEYRAMAKDGTAMR